MVQSGEQKEKRMRKNEQSPGDVGDIIKRSNMWDTSCKRGGGRRTASIFEETMAEDFPKIMKSFNVHI